MPTVPVHSAAPRAPLSAPACAARQTEQTQTLSVQAGCTGIKSQRLRLTHNIV